MGPATVGGGYRLIDDLEVICAQPVDDLDAGGAEELEPRDCLAHGAALRLEGGHLVS